LVLVVGKTKPALLLKVRVWMLRFGLLGKRITGEQVFRRLFVLRRQIGYYYALLALATVL